MAIDFDSSDPPIGLGSLSVLSGAAEMTIATWIRLSTTTADNAIAMRGSQFSTIAPWILWRDENGSFSGRVKTLAGVVNTDVGLLRIEAANNSLNDTNWHHVAMVFQAGVSDGLRLLIDGVRDPNIQSTLGHLQIASDTATVTISTSVPTRQFEGSMAEFSIWNTALSDFAVARLASGFSPLLLPGALDRLVVYQDFVRGMNRPGVGPNATSTGTYDTSGHPRVICRHGSLTSFSSATSLIPGPHRSSSAELTAGGSSAAALFAPGSEQGSLQATGEVNS